MVRAWAGVVACLAAACAHAPAPVPVTPAPPAPEISVAPAVPAPVACETTSSVDDEAWTYFELCTPHPIPPVQRAVAPFDDVELGVGVLDGHEQLLAYGFPDVRGAELRLVRVDRHLASDTGTPLLALVLPEDGPVRFAVTRVGLVWPVQSMGPPLDLAARCQHAIELLEQAWALPQRSDERAALEEEAGSACPATIAWPALLAEHPDLARRITDPFAGSADSWIAAFAPPWMGALYDRAIREFGVGHDDIALADVRACAALLPRVRPLLRRDDAWFERFAALSLIEDEIRRRAARPPWPPLDVPDGPLDAATVRARIDRLEDADLWREDDPLALVSAGPAAFEPLVACVESDLRVTRHVESTFGGHLRATSVCELCARDLTTAIEPDVRWLITGTRGSCATPEDRAILAASYRAYAAATAGRSEADAVFAVLADDGAGPSRWAGAAAYLTRPDAFGAEDVGCDEYDAYDCQDETSPDRPLPPPPAMPNAESLPEAARARLEALLVDRATRAAALDRDDDLIDLLRAATQWAPDTAAAALASVAVALARSITPAYDEEWTHLLAHAFGHAAPEATLPWLVGWERDVADGYWSAPRLLLSSIDIPLVAQRVGAALGHVRVTPELFEPDSGEFVRHLRALAATGFAPAGRLLRRVERSASAPRGAGL